VTVGGVGCQRGGHGRGADQTVRHPGSSGVFPPGACSTHGYPCPAWQSDPRCLVLPNGLDTTAPAARTRRSTCARRPAAARRRGPAGATWVRGVTGRKTPLAHTPDRGRPCAKHGNRESRGSSLDRRAHDDEAGTRAARGARRLPIACHLLGRRERRGRSGCDRRTWSCSPSSREGPAGRGAGGGRGWANRSSRSDLPGVPFSIGGRTCPGVTIISPPRRCPPRGPGPLGRRPPDVPPRRVTTLPPTPSTDHRRRRDRPSKPASSPSRRPRRRPPGPVCGGTAMIAVFRVTPPRLADRGRHGGSARLLILGSQIGAAPGSRLHRGYRRVARRPGGARTDRARPAGHAPPRRNLFVFVLFHIRTSFPFVLSGNRAAAC